MSDSGFGNISSPARAAGKSGVIGSGQIIQLTKLPDGLENIAKTIRLEGEITKANKDGSIRIATPSGEIEAKVRGNKQPQQGQRIDIEIPAGRPPRQATIRNATPVESSGRITTPNISEPPPSQPQIQRTTIAGTRLSSTQPPPPTEGQTQQTRIAPRSQPVPPAIQEAVSQSNQTNSTAPSRPIIADSVVRLISVPPAQAQAIATEFVQTQAQPQLNIITRAEFTGNLIAQNTQNQLSQTLIQNVQNTPPQALTQNVQNTPAQNLQNPTTQIAPQQTTPQLNASINQLLSLIPQIQNTTQPILNNSFFQAPAIIQTALITPTPTQAITAALPALVNTVTIPDIQTLPANSANTILQAVPTSPTNTANSVTAQQTNLASQNVTLTPIPVTFDPANPTSIIAPRVDRIDVQILRITPPQLALTPPTIGNIVPQTQIPAATQFTPPLTSANNATSITAQVTGFTANNLPLVTARFPGAPLPQSFVLQFKSNNLQLGSQLQIIPKTSGTAPTATQTLAQLSTNNPLLRGFQWPALDELYNGLVRINPQAASSLSRALPNAGNPAQIAPAAMMFIAAVKSGNMAGFFGDKKMDLIQRSSGSDIFSKLTQGASNTARAQTAEPASAGEWRAVPLPMFWEGEIHKITLYTRHENQQGQQQDQENNQTRFVFDLSLTRMGDVQLDGLLRNDRLDLVIRTQNAFSEPMQQTMRQAYSTALGHTELSGELNFQGSTKNWVHVLEKEEQLGVNA